MAEITLKPRKEDIMPLLGILILVIQIIVACNSKSDPQDHVG